MSKMIILMKETGMTTVEDLAIRLSNTRVQLELMQGDVRRNNQVIRDIDDFFAAIEDYRELAPLRDQLSKLRYWTRKAIPNALPERDDFSEQMEVRENRRELEQVMDAAIDAVTQETDEQQPAAKRPVLEKKHDQARA